MDKSNDRCMASDILGMLEAAKENRLDISKGFAIAAYDFGPYCVIFHFAPKQLLSRVPVFSKPESVRMKKFNVAATLEKDNKPEKGFLLLSTDKKIDASSSEEELLKWVDSKGVAEYGEALKELVQSTMITNPNAGPNAGSGQTQ